MTNMIIEADFFMFKQYISCSADVGEAIEQLQEDFWEWLFDKSIEHSYWQYHNGEKFGANYRADAFVYWLNNVRFKQTVAELIENPSDMEADKRIVF